MKKIKVSDFMSYAFVENINRSGLKSLWSQRGSTLDHLFHLLQTQLDGFIPYTIHNTLGQMILIFLRAQPIRLNLNGGDVTSCSKCQVLGLFTFGFHSKLHTFDQYLRFLPCRKNGGGRFSKPP